MDELNKIPLNSSLLTALYRNSLVEIAPLKAGKKALVAVKTALTSAQEDFLAQILKACNLAAGQVAIVNTSQKGVVIEKLISELSPRYVLSFGTGTGTELFRMENSTGRKYLNAPALEEMMQNSEESKQLKRKTWVELKDIFDL